MPHNGRCFLNPELNSGEWTEREEGKTNPELNSGEWTEKEDEGKRKKKETNKTNKAKKRRKRKMEGRKERERKEKAGKGGKRKEKEGKGRRKDMNEGRKRDRRGAEGSVRKRDRRGRYVEARKRNRERLEQLAAAEGLSLDIVEEMWGQWTEDYYVRMRSYVDLDGKRKKRIQLCKMPRKPGKSVKGQVAWASLMQEAIARARVVYYDKEKRAALDEEYEAYRMECEAKGKKALVKWNYLMQKMRAEVREERGM